MKRLYRAVAYYEGAGSAVTRHFQTKRARDSWAAKRRAGLPATEQYSHLTGSSDGAGAIPPALRVDVADSDPITWGET